MLWASPSKRGVGVWWLSVKSKEKGRGEEVKITPA